MLKLLLDFPWRLDAALDADPRPQEVIRDFINVLSQLPFDPVRFVHQEELGIFYEKLANYRGGGREVVVRFLSHVAAGEGGPYRAVPVNGPDDVRDSWQRALRDAMGDLANWRTPQIVIPADRMPKWQRCIHDHEAVIELEDRPEDGQHKRVALIMRLYKQEEGLRYEEDYVAHKYAMADINPWDLRHCKYDGNGDLDQRCWLPRPSSLGRVALTDLEDGLRTLRSESWPSKGKYWFIPPGSWTAGLAKDRWRAGAFAEESAPNRKKGPVDYKGQVWFWHPQEGHWDVQLPGGKYKKVKPNGDPWE